MENLVWYARKDVYLMIIKRQFSLFLHKSMCPLISQVQQTNKIKLNNPILQQKAFFKIRFKILW